jgi:hypothetical protein
MAWHRAWIGVSGIALCGGLLAGCASNLPPWAQNQQSLADDISSPAEARLARLQRSDPPALPPQQSLPPITLPPPPQPAAPKQDSGIQQVSARGMVRVRIIAWVNGKPIYEDEVINMAGPDLARVARSGGSDAAAKQAEIIHDVLKLLIDQELMYQDAMKKIEQDKKTMKELKGFVDREFDKTLDRWRKAKPPVPEDEIKKMEPTVRRLLERNLVASEYARARFGDIVKGKVNLELIREYYDTHKNEFQTVDKVVWQDIFIPTSPSLPTVADAKRFAEDLINKCRKSEDFNGLMVYNKGPTTLHDGIGLGQRLGHRDPANGAWIPGDIQPEELEQPLSKLREGEIGPVIPLTTGVHLMRVVKREYQAQLPLDDKVQTTIRKKLENELADREYARIKTELRNRAVIQIERAP